MSVYEWFGTEKFADYRGSTKSDDRKLWWSDPIVGDPLPPLSDWLPPKLTQYLGEHELLRAGAPEAGLKNIEGVTAEDVRRVVLEHLRPERRTNIEVYPKEWQDPNQTVMPRFHIVSSGENLTLIAKRHGSTPQAIAKLNGINEKQRIYPGQKLRVPVGAKKPTGATTTRSRSSDTGVAPGPSPNKKKEALVPQGGQRAAAMDTGIKDLLL